MKTRLLLVGAGGFGLQTYYTRVRIKYRTPNNKKLKKF